MPAGRRPRADHSGVQRGAPAARDPAANAGVPRRAAVAVAESWWSTTAASTAPRASPAGWPPRSAVPVPVDVIGCSRPGKGAAVRRGLLSSSLTVRRLLRRRPGHPGRDADRGDGAPAGAAPPRSIASRHVPGAGFVQPPAAGPPARRRGLPRCPAAAGRRGRRHPVRLQVLPPGRGHRGAGALPHHRLRLRRGAAAAHPARRRRDRRAAGGLDRRRRLHLPPRPRRDRQLRRRCCTDAASPRCRSTDDRPRPRRQRAGSAVARPRRAACGKSLVLNWRDVRHPQAGGAEQYMHRDRPCGGRPAGADVVLAHRAPGRPARAARSIDGVTRRCGRAAPCRVYPRTARVLRRIRGGVRLPWSTARTGSRSSPRCSSTAPSPSCRWCTTSTRSSSPPGSAR